MYDAGGEDNLLLKNNKLLCVYHSNNVRTMSAGGLSHGCWSSSWKDDGRLDGSIDRHCRIRSCAASKTNQKHDQTNYPPNISLTNKEEHTTCLITSQSFPSRKAHRAALTCFVSPQPNTSLHCKTTNTVLVHCTACLFLSQLSPLHLPTERWPGWVGLGGLLTWVTHLSTDLAQHKLCW